MNVPCQVCGGSGKRDGVSFATTHCNACGGTGYQDDGEVHVLSRVFLPDPNVAELLKRVAELLKLITDIDASDFLEHSIPCTIHAHGDMANAVCSCGLNALQERINKALA